MISAPGVYELTADEYHADPVREPSLSSSLARLLANRTPRHAWEAHPRLNPNFERTESERFDIGNAAHSLILGDPKQFAIVAAPNWKTKAAQEARKQASADGKIPLLEEQFDRVQAMVRSARVQLDKHRDARDAFTNGKPEMSLIWEESGVWFRCRPDWLPNAGSVFDDYKTADSADPDEFQRSVIRFGYDVQASFYQRGLKALGIHDRPQFRFVVQETVPPFALSVLGLAPGFLDLADRKVEKAIRLWTECRATNEWPGYPLQTCWLDCPQWHEADYLNREVRDHDASRAELRRAAEMQAPL